MCSGLGKSGHFICKLFVFQTLFSIVVPVNELFRYEGVPRPKLMNEITIIINPARTADSIITDLKVKSVELPEWSALLKDYEPTLHKIVHDTGSRKDKIRSDGTKEVASRSHIGLEKLLVKLMT